MPHQKYPKIVLYCLACLMLAFFASNRLFRGDLAGWKLIISSDGLGYYAYLPALLIDHDVSYQKVTEKEKKILGYNRYEPGYLVKQDNRVVDKYFAGEALLLLPFFLFATFISWIGGIEISGYSFFFQLFTGLGALFYLFLGLYYLNKILQHIKIQPILTAVILVAILLGTNLFYYSLWQPCMSHVYSFFAINGTLWYFCRTIQSPRLKNIILAGLFLGLTVLIRPTNGIIILLIPFLFNTSEEARLTSGFLRKSKLPLLLFFVAFMIVISIQFLLWHIQTGRWLIWSYKDEGFLFGHPQIINELFSYRKGLFIYTPLIFLSLLGCFRLLHRNLTRFFSIFLFVVLSTYIISSWWNWYYGDSFGARAFIDYYGIYAIMMAILLSHKETKTGTTLVIIILFPFIALNLFQTWQYTHYIIHPYSMSKVKYQYVFLKADSVYQKCLGGNDEIPGYTMDMAHPFRLYRTDLEKVSDVWKNSVNKIVPYAHSGRFVGYMDSLYPYSATLEIRPDTLTDYPALFYVEGSVWVRDSIKGASDKAYIVFSMDSIDQQGNYWYGFPVNDVPDNPAGVWRKCRFSLTLPEFRVPGKVLKIYIWNNGKKPLMIDDFSVTFFTEKKKMGIR
jgi:uncharacterized membrane protein YphA (DoxX/SURF4 family)